jgi:hypothetical protein
MRLPELLWIALALSAVGTLFCWRRILRKADLRFFKIINLIISAIPILGPIMYLFIDMPPRNRIPYTHSFGSFQGNLSIAQLVALLSRARREEALGAPPNHTMELDAGKERPHHSS